MMGKQTAVAVTLLAALAGCSDNNDNHDVAAEQSPTVVSPLAHAILAGMQVTVDGTTSPLTDGTLSLAAGQPFTLTIGDFNSAEVIASDELTLFALFGAEPQLDANAIYQALQNEDYQGSLAQVSNLISWLLAWDENFDLSDGIQARSLDWLQMSDGLSFNLPYRDFIEQQLQPRLRQQGWRLGYPFEYALLHYYRLLGLQVAGFRELTVEQYRAGVLELTWHSSYDDNGLPIRRAGYGSKNELVANDWQQSYNDYLQPLERRFDYYDVYGQLVQGDVAQHRYDPLGNRSYWSETEDSGNRSYTSEEVTLRSQQGLPTVVSYRSYADGDLRRQLDHHYLYNEQFQASSVTVKQDLDPEVDGIELSQQQLFEYDQQGNQRRFTELEDADNDGVVDSRLLVEWRFDAAGQQLFYGNYFDNDNDGVIDSYNSRTRTYDEQGNNSSYYYVNDSDNDGSWDSNVYSLYRWDDNGNRIGITNYRNYLDAATYSQRETIEYHYDGRNQPISYQSLTDTNGDGKPERASYSSTEYHNDDQGRILSQIHRADFDGDGVVNSVTTETYRYDDNGLLQQSTLQTDFNNDGILDRDERAIYHYEAVADVLGTLLHRLNN
ncbi:RHS repeat protein [Ferrimonas senticii]|uniref:RHS repeat protein n=1 Tax=Ferrimonas senticii TaxID=394566 RepID=UPI0003FFF32C|nr:RHS repeat protein [Ferrimonas senticii]